jgi:hypothetical protein
MSKKSRRRNRKILGALAAGLGAAALMRGKGVNAANVDSGRGSGLRKTVDDVTSVIKPVMKPVNTGSNFQSRFKGKIANNRWAGPGEISGVTNKVADVAPNVITSTVPRVHSARGMNVRYKKGGRVTGAAKRGFGRALMNKGRKK